MDHAGECGPCRGRMRECGGQRMPLLATFCTCCRLAGALAAGCARVASAAFPRPQIDYNSWDSPPCFKFREWALDSQVGRWCLLAFACLSAVCSEEEQLS